MWSSSDGGRSWQPRCEGPAGEGVQVVGYDPSNLARLWAVGAGQVWRSDRQGERWRSVGKPVSDTPAIARAVAVLDDVIMVATDRAVFRSADAGESWAPPDGSLPAHLAAGMLVRDPRSPATLYAGFAIAQYEDLQPRAPPDEPASERPKPGEPRWRRSAFRRARPLRDHGGEVSGARTPSSQPGPHRDALGRGAAMSASAKLQAFPAWSRRAWLGLAIALAVAAGLALLIWPTRPWDSRAFEEIKLPSRADMPVAIATARDGTVWFTLESSDSIGRIRNGQVERIPKGAESIEPLGLAVDCRRRGVVHGGAEAKDFPRFARWQHCLLRALDADCQAGTLDDRAGWRRVVRRTHGRERDAPARWTLHSPRRGGARPKGSGRCRAVRRRRGVRRNGMGDAPERGQVVADFS